MIINLAGISYDSIVDGPGLRTTLFSQGCPHGCPGCHNPETWAFVEKNKWNVDDLVKHILQQSPRALTFSGGEPFSQAEAFCKIASALKEYDFNLWSYSGYTFEELLNGSPAQQNFLRTLDVLVDGKFVLEKKSLALKYKGSSNQRVIDVQQSLKQNKIVLFEEVTTHSLNQSVKLYI